MTSKGFGMNEDGKPKVNLNKTPKIGFTEYAEKLNGRLAMIGFASLIAIEVLTGHGLVGWLTSL
jgi:hypothetical protein